MKTLVLVLLLFLDSPDFETREITTQLISYLPQQIDLPLLCFATTDEQLYRLRLIDETRPHEPESDESENIGGEP